MFREIRKKRNKIEDSAAEELLIIMTGRTGKSIFMARTRGIRSMLCGHVIRYVLRFMEMRRSGRKPGHRLCRVRLCSGDVI